MELKDKLVTAINSGNLTGGDLSFANDLLNGKWGLETRGFLTERQALFVDKLYEKATAKKKPAKKLDLTKVYQFLHRARENLKRPRIMLAFPDGKPIKVYLAGNTSRVPGAVNIVTEGEDGALDKWLGRVLESGEWEHRELDKDTEKQTVAVMKRLNDNPQEVVSEYGRLHGFCAFCNRPLEDERSTEVGYGPICAKRWSLPWG